MKHLTIILILLLSVTPHFGKAQDGVQRKEENLVWFTDLSKAHEISASTKKPIFAFFTGSDWCGWCHKLQREVFAKAEFIDWAKKNVVLLELDFPRGKSLSPELTQQNQGLQQQFQVRGYPTIWMFYANKSASTNQFSLNALGSLGYPSGAVKGKEEVKFLEDANRILSNSQAK